MSERRKRSRRSVSTDAADASISEDRPPDQTLGSCREEEASSQISADESVLGEGSMFTRPDFCKESPRGSQQSETESETHSCLPMKSDSSMYHPPDMAQEETERQSTGGPSSPRRRKKLKKEPEHQRKAEEQTGYVHPSKAKQALKEAMQKKFALTSEGSGDQWGPLNSIYTALHTITGEIGGPHEEHEFRRFERKLKKKLSTEIDLLEIFKLSPGPEKPPRTVLTQGVAGIGKSFAVQKFILDWANEEANLDIDFVFSLAFRELNLIKGKKSLHQLLTEFHPVLRELKDSEDYIRSKVTLILDGLDESRLQLDFKSNRKVTSVSEVTSLRNLLANLIQGNLLPDANLWITSRPVAANQVPVEYVDMVTEIRGFNDLQKEDYFKKRFSQDLSLADRIISHIQSSQSLDIMCQIPIFCWISALLFQEVFRGDEKTETPQTLTEMMAHFLFVQTKHTSRKKDKKTEKSREQLLKTHREFLLKLGKLAFVELQKNNLIFYEEDLKDCGVDIKEAPIYSGFFNAVLREEEVFSQKKVFFFVHLTVQEFFAALFVYECLTNKRTSELSEFLDLKEQRELNLLDLLKTTVDKVLEVKNVNLDFFLRFLLGLMVEPNRRVLQGLLPSPDPNQETDKKILTYLKSIRRKTLSPDSCVSIFQAMVEMRDHKVKDEIQEYLKLTDRSKTDLTPLHCSALAYMLQVSKNDVDVLDLKSFHTSEEGRRRLIPAVRSSRKAILADCKVILEWVKHLVFALEFPYSCLRDLDLSNNDLKDEGVKQLCDGLSRQCCRLQALRLSGCLITEKGCEFLASAMKSNPSNLIELDLSYNHPGDSGKKLLTELQNDPGYKLSQLSVEHGGIHRLKPGFKKYACELTLDPSTAHQNLQLSEGNRKVSWAAEEQKYPHHEERFDHWPQVLCERGLDGRSYWELDVEEPFHIGVTYRTIGRKGDVSHCRLGHNDKSWSLICSNDGCFVLHHNDKFPVCSFSPRSSRVGVYLDWPAGTLSFYRISSDSLTRLYTFKTQFTEPLYPAVELIPTDSSASFCRLT
ncbi:NACHT, LRR and PYD domains-containing protein 5-like isoform X2 [Mastacembelus armatus]|nr:NACHT, LRR and PYD domains-containing protein 5-like isoform X2 [Mastacembelus armatus]